MSYDVNKYLFVTQLHKECNTSLLEYKAHFLKTQYTSRNHRQA